MGNSIYSLDINQKNRMSLFWIIGDFSVKSEKLGKE